VDAALEAAQLVGVDWWIGVSVLLPGSQQN
jgi:hypothetical protein